MCPWIHILTIGGQPRSFGCLPTNVITDTNVKCNEYGKNTGVLLFLGSGIVYTVKQHSIMVQEMSYQAGFKKQ